MTITFVGHSSIPSKAGIKDLVKQQLRNNVLFEKSITCYVGGYGDFDEICAYACKELKKEISNIEIVYVTPYVSLSAQERIKNLLKNNLCDTSIYPPLENVPPKFAISKRNEWMINNANLIIAYVNCNFGGAYKSLQMAKRKNKKTINIYDLL